MARIIAIEDNSHNMRLIEQILKDISENIELVKADSGHEAIMKAGDARYDLVLMDIALPDIDGIKMTRLLKTYPQFKDTPFVAVTAYATLKDKENFRQIFTDYISKPIDEDKFIKTVTGLIGDKL